MKVINPVNWRIQRHNEQQKQHFEHNDLHAPLVSLINDRGHQFHVHPIDARLVRVVHSLPPSEAGGAGPLAGVALRNHGRTDEAGIDGFHWERRTCDWSAEVDEKERCIRIQPRSTSSGVRIQLDYTRTITLTWSWYNDGQDTNANGLPVETAYLQDFKSAYSYDARTKRVYHMVCRDQSYMPLSEHARPANENHVPQDGRFEFVYGLGETKGPMMKDGKRYVMEARDSLAADPQDTDPLYKLCPYYLHYNAKSDLWFGLYYNTLVPSVFDFSGEHDFATGQFRTFSAEKGPLDYYMLLGQEAEPSTRPRPAAIVSQLATLVTPACFGPAGRRGSAALDGWQASPTLPPHNQFGYLASSLTLSERDDAQTAVVEYVEEARRHGFPIDSMHLSSGYCVDAETGERKYFYWDKQKYPDPKAMGELLEKRLACKVIINVKPWLLESHPYYEQTAQSGAFIRAAPDARPVSAGARPADEDRCGSHASVPSRTLHWARGMGDTGKGSYLDYSSLAGSQAWATFIRHGVLANNITGIWDDNNEFSSTIDDEDEVLGEIDMWSLPEMPLIFGTGKAETDHQEQAQQVATRLGWGRRPVSIGAVGPATQTMGMARATFATLIEEQPDKRPVVVTRSAVPGIQAFAHSTWSGDNSTTWLSLKWSTKLSMSVGLSFGLGLYGHDIGGFAGAHSPSAELLLRWCQQSMWMTRFTIHSWKAISTTPWMFGNVQDDVTGRSVTDMLRDIILFRYRLLPTLYSLYVTQYHRHGWPVIRPLLWHHSRHLQCLTQDEQFLVGSHILVSPVCDAGVAQSSFFLPHLVDPSPQADDGRPDNSNDACWFELDTGKVHRPSKDGNMTTIDAPLHRCPTLVREGGIYVLGPMLNTHIPSPAPTVRTYTAQLFPCPVAILSERSVDAESSGSFTLFEDDGETNDATASGQFTELELRFSTQGQKDIYADINVVASGHPGQWQITFALPHGDDRRLHCGKASLTAGAQSADDRVQIATTVNRPDTVLVTVGEQR